MSNDQTVAPPTPSENNLIADASAGAAAVAGGVTGAVIGAVAADELEIPTQLLENWHPIVKELAKLPSPTNPRNMLVAATNARYCFERSTLPAKKRIIAAWSSLDDNAKTKILETVRACAVPTGVNPSTNKHDRACLIHVFADPFFTTLFTGAARVKTREELDDKETPVDWWGQIADAFNDYDGVPYTNLTVQIGPDGKARAPRAAVPGMEIPFSTCGDIDPSMGNEKRPLRDGAWMQQTLRDFKGNWAPVWQAFKASGQQDAADPFDEYLKFNRGDDLLMYAYVVFKGQDIEALNDLLGKTLPEGVGRDTGVLGAAPNATPSVKGRGKAGKNGKGSVSPQKKTIILQVDDKAAGSRASAAKEVLIIQEEKGETDLALQILSSTGDVSEGTKRAASDALAEIMAEKKRRRTERSRGEAKE